MYRSGQPSGADVWQAEELGVRSIINLRGFRPGRLEWDVEWAVAKHLGVEIFWVGMAASRLPSRYELLELFEIFDRAEVPVLIHCQAGVDRSGMAAVLWLMVVEGVPKCEARKQLSIWKGHLWFWQGTGNLDKFIDMLPDNPDRVRAWIENEYNDGEPWPQVIP